MMKSMKFYAAACIVAVIASMVLPACKGEDDPIISLISRKDRFTNAWTLTKYEIDGTTQDLNGATYEYNVANNGTLTQTIQGSIFGFPTRFTSDGTWSFMNDDEDVKIVVGNETTTYNIQRLASKELWLRKTVDTSTYTYYFEGL